LDVILPQLGKLRVDLNEFILHNRFYIFNPVLLKLPTAQRFLFLLSVLNMLFIFIKLFLNND
jgi:hypothetical protein